MAKTYPNDFNYDEKWALSSRPMVN